MKKNGVFLFVISHLVPEIVKIFVLCKLGTDDVRRCDNMEVKTQNSAGRKTTLICDQKRTFLKFGSYFLLLDFL